MHSTPEISPILIRDYAKAKGWQFIAEATNDGLFVLNHPTEKYTQIVFPVDSEAADYGDAISLAIRRLAEFEGTAPDNLVEDLLDADADRFRFRLFRSGSQLESIPIGVSATSLDGIRKLLLTGACTELKPRWHHPRLSGTVPEQFVAACRMGHTEAGSFVMKVSCPLDAVPSQSSTSGSDDTGPFTRRVTIGITKALAALSQALIKDTLDDLVSGAKTSDNHVSSNLCDSLLHLFDSNIGNNVEVLPSWSGRRPLPSGIQLPTAIRFLKEQVSRIEEVQRALSPSDPDESNVFVGTVEKLEGEMNDEGAREGYVILNLLLPESGESVRARTYLPAHDHATAIRAYEQEGSYVELKGILRSGRQPRTLDNPTSFQLIDSANTKLGTP